MDEHRLMLLGLLVTVAGVAWYNQQVENPVLTAAAALALLALWVRSQLGPEMEDDESPEDD